MNGHIVQKKLEHLIKQEKEAYGFVGIDVEVMEDERGCFLRGSVVLKKQKRKILKECGVIRENIIVREDIREGGEVFWARCGVSLLDVYQKPLATFSSEAERDRLRHTQVEQGEIVRVLGQEGDFLLIQTYDFTLGWIGRAHVEMLGKEDGERERERWLHIQRVEPERYYSGDPQELVATAKTFLGVPYLFGGVTFCGIDCSAFIQQVYWRGCGLLLPKHSQDQRLCGVESAFGDLRIGDLIFLKYKKTRVYHVVLVIDRDHVIHASRRAGKVVIWKTEILDKVYDYLGTRRILT